MKTHDRAFGPGARGLALLCLLGLASAPTGGAAQEPVTLDDAIQRALERSPTMAQSRATLSGAQVGQRSAWGSFLPSVSVGSSASRSSSQRFDPATDRQVSGSSQSYSAGIDGSFTVFEGGRRFDELAQSRADVRAARAGLEEQRYTVILQTKSLFFEALRQGELLEVARSRVDQAQQSLELVRQRARLGRGTTSDTLRARLELANARQSALTAETARRAARFALGRQMGEEVPVVPMTPEDLGPSPLPLSDAEVLQAAEDAAPGVQAARFSAGAAAAGVEAARSTYLPSFQVSSGYTWSNGAFSFDQGATSWSIRLSGSYPVFNGFNREAGVQRARDALHVARTREEDARLAARQEADAALQGLRTAEQAIDIAGEAVIVAEEDLRVVRERYRLGVATILDLVTSQIALEQAQADLITARYDYELARAELESVLGREL